MEHTKIQNQTRINSSEINDKIKELGTVGLGIHREIPKIESDIKHRDSEYLKIKKSLKEEYSHQNTSTVASHVLNGGDYHKELNDLHKNTEPFIDTSESHNAHDNYIHEVLRKGVPSGETVSHVLDVIHGNELSNANSQYLQRKWHPFLDAHARKSAQIKTIDNAEYTKDELSKIPSNMQPKGLRILTHQPSLHHFELHPEHGLQYIGASTKVRYDSRGTFDTVYQGVHKKLKPEYEDFAADAITKYTLDSSPVNKYHQLVHKGTPVDVVSGIPKTDIERISTDVSDYIKNVPHPTHLGDFHVYTGLYAESNPRTDALHHDEDGNLIVHNPSFTSTSIHEPIAYEFAKMKHDAADGTVGDIFKIRVPGGYPHGSYIQPNSEHDHEYEYLLDKGHTFKVNPVPKYIAHDNAIYRVWETELHAQPHDKLIDFENQSKSIKTSMVLDKNASLDTLAKGVADDSSMVRAAAAKHPNLSTEHFDTLAKDFSPKVRMALGRNPNVPDHIVKSSIGDLSFAAGYAQNPRISPEHVDSILNHDYSSVGAEFAARHDLTDEHIGKIITLSDPKHLAALAGNTSMHPDLLDAFSNASDKNILSALAGNSSIHRETLKKLKESNVPGVYEIARKNPANHRLQ